MVGADVEAVLVRVAVTCHLCSEVVAVWGGDGCIRSRVGWVGWCREGESGREGE